jgi:hypothetical protein
VTAVERDDDALRAELAEALWAHDSGRDDIPLSSRMAGTQRVYAATASRLLPIVLAYAERRAAAELQNAAAGIRGGGTIAGLPGAARQALNIAADVVDARASALSSGVQEPGQ